MSVEGGRHGDRSSKLGFGSNSGNPHLAGRGKTGVVVAAGAALLIGAANAIVTFFSGLGAGV